jgi:membrane fusion protein, multidrug efflux system
MMKLRYTMIKNNKYKASMKGFMIIIWAILIVGCNERQQSVNAKKEEPKPDSVKVFLLTADSVKKTITLPGELAPNENVQIRAKVQGFIQKINVDIGSKVRKGQVLALIDAPEINSRVQELSAKVKAAQSRFNTSKDYYDRINAASKVEGVVAGKELQQAKNQMLTDSAEYNAAVFAVSSYRQMGNYLAIVAPFTGTITKRNIDPGTFVGNTNDQPLFELEDNSKLELRVPVPETYTGAVLAGNTAELTTRSFPDKKFKAKLIRKSGSIDNQSRTEIWEFEVPNNNGELKAGGYSDVKLVFMRPEKSLVVPTSAVVTTLERKFVIRVMNNTTQWVDVRPGFNMGDKQEIFGELVSGDTIIMKPTEELKSGTSVKPKL